jgi:beta-glucosidase
LLACTAATVVPGPARAHAAGCPWSDAGAPASQRAHQLVAAMSLDQKVAMTAQQEYIWQHYGVAGYIAGDPSICVPDLVLNDAGQGVGDMSINTTAFPAPIAQSASWDPALQQRMGDMLGWEAWHKGINVQLAPAIEVDRVPMNGRNFEYLGEDPYLAGQGAAALTRGLQAEHVIATLKHYIANSQETNRMSDSSDVDARTLHEIYMPPYDAAIRQAHAGAVMCSYNKINTVYACENPTTLDQYLKSELGFTGFVMSDWNGTHSTVPAANAGLDMEMGATPGFYFGAKLKAAVAAGQVSASRLDDMVLRIVLPMFEVGLFDHPIPAQPGAYASNVDTPEAVKLALDVAEQGTVLLKNSGNVLPLAGGGKRIAVIGYSAGPAGAEATYNGGGSSHIPEFTNKPVTNPLQSMQQVALANGDVVVYADGSSMADAIAAAGAADVAVVFAYDQESEGSDRSGLTLQGSACAFVVCVATPVNQDQLISTVAQANPNTVVVLTTGGPVLMPWVDHVKGIVEAWYPGQQQGDAIAAVLFGLVDPSGKLPETFPRSASDLPTQTPAQYPGVNLHSAYSEGLDVGYRWYDDRGIEPLFPFGHGLSYTTFGYSNLRLSSAPSPSAPATVSFDVTNTGTRRGAEVAQLYIGAPTANQVHEPPKQLRGFAKVLLDPGQTAHVSLPVDARAVSYWNVGSHGWAVEPGCHPVLVGSSSRDIRLQGGGLDGSLAGCAVAAAGAPAAVAAVQSTLPNTAAVAPPPLPAAAAAPVAPLAAVGAGVVLARLRRRRSTRRAGSMTSRG